MKEMEIAKWINKNYDSYQAQEDNMEMAVQDEYEDKEEPIFDIKTQRDIAIGLVIVMMIIAAAFYCENVSLVNIILEM